MGLSGLEPPTSRLSGVRSNRLSYKPVPKRASATFPLFYSWQPPALPHRLQCSTIGRLGLNHRVRDGYGCFPQAHRHQESLDAFDSRLGSFCYLLFARLESISIPLPLHFVRFKPSHASCLYQTLPQASLLSHLFHPACALTP